MTAPAVPGWPGVAASAALVALAALLAGRARLGLAADMLVASARALGQLVAVAAVLAAVFAHGGLPGSLAWIAVMVLIAGRVAARRARGLPRALAVATLAVGMATVVTVATLVVFAVIDTRPHVLIPVSGMVVSGAMQATALTLTRLHEEVETARPRIEARLSLGLDAAAAFAPHARTALRTAMLPAVDATKVVGLISLPGAMTGLILAGVEPLTAIRYQIVVMYMLLAAATLAAVATARLARTALFDDAHRLHELPAPPGGRSSPR
ncbi:ABC transporter permease [Streptosporangium sp. NPDC050855]|uniref:ABC transporter permease n=1 Tax=Streptosporangium sp. NPDC050855 TaxID=3366194 RepID=UPI0037943985